MKKERSCGAVVYRKGKDGLEILVIQHKNGGHWAFPKGHVEKNETDEETAFREIWEETGLKVKLDTGFRQIVTYSPKADTMKDVVYFAGKAGPDDKVKAQEKEVDDIRWKRPKDAEALVTYQNDKDVLKSFLEYRKEKKERK